MSLKESLEAFVAHVKSLEDEDEDGDDGYTKDFQTLKHQSNQYRVEGTFPTSHGERDCNRRKNRYKDILPFDYTRVVLPEVPGQPGTDYINANFIKGATGQQTYIASQGPLTHTVPDFWRMVWAYTVRVIIMTSNEYEAGKMKCACYWPKAGEEKHFGDMTVTLGEEREVGSKDFIVRELHLLRGDQVRVIHQLHYVAWPDHGVPGSVKPLLDIMAVAREYQSSDTPPMVIHCSAGCGRTGTLCAIDYAWTLLKLGRLNMDFCLFEIITEMRKQRPSIVQALDQYILVHHAVVQLFNSYLQMILQYEAQTSAAASQPPRSRSPYENVVESQEPIFHFNVQEVNPGVSIDKSPNGEYDDVLLCQGDLVQKAIRENVNRLIQSAPALGISLVPPKGHTPAASPAHARHATSPRVRLRKADVENGYTQIQLQHPLPVPRRARMDRNSSSSSSTSSASGVPSERTPAETRVVEPDYEVLSRARTLEPSCVDASSTVAIVQPCATLAGSGPCRFQNRTYDNVTLDMTGRVTLGSSSTQPAQSLQPARNPAVTFLPIREPLNLSAHQSADTQRSVPVTGSKIEHPRPIPASWPATMPHKAVQGGARKNRDFASSEPMRTSLMIQENTLYSQKEFEMKGKRSPQHLRSASDSQAMLCAQSSRTLPLAASPTKQRQPQQTQHSPETVSPQSPDWSAKRPPMPLPKPRYSPNPVCKEGDLGTVSPQEADTSAYSYAKAESVGPGRSKTSEYSYADPNALGKWSLQHVARGVPFDAVLEGDYAELVEDRNMGRHGAGGLIIPPPTGRKNSSQEYDEVNPSGGCPVEGENPYYSVVRNGQLRCISDEEESAPQVPPKTQSSYQSIEYGGGIRIEGENAYYSVAGNGRLQCTSDDEAPPHIPPKSQSSYQSVEDGDENVMVTGPLSRSLDTLSESVTTGVLTFGRKLRQKMQQTFGKPSSSSCPGPDASSFNATSPTGNAIYFKGKNIGFPNRVRQPRGPRNLGEMPGAAMPIRKTTPRH